VSSETKLSLLSLFAVRQGTECRGLAYSWCTVFMTQCSLNSVKRYKFELEKLEFILKAMFKSIFYLSKEYLLIFSKEVKNY
jgi:hypothetical protein